jgi:hypothetical protein
VELEIGHFLKHFVGILHDGYDHALSDLNEEQFYFRPSDRANHIAFTAWHWVRTEDNVVQFVLQRQQTVWLADQLDERWGLPRVAQGTGMPPEEAHALRIPSVGEFLGYARKVWACTDQYLENVTPEELGRIVKMNPFGEIPVLQGLGQTIIAHGNQHLGEIWLMRELQGLPGLGF